MKKLNFLKKNKHYFSLKKFPSLVRKSHGDEPWPGPELKDYIFVDFPGIFKGTL